MHLSAPFGSSVNDHISKEDFTLKYSTVDNAVAILQRLGPSAAMAKIDIKHALRLCLVRRDDWDLLGAHWNGRFYVDKRLPFGLRSAPFLFNRVADSLHWILVNECGIKAVVHYLDDFFIAAESMVECDRFLHTILKVFDNIGVPLAPEKVAGPASVFTFLGIELDVLQQELRLPPDKLADLLAIVQDWLSKTKCRKRELLSLLGTMNFACKAVPAGRFFFDGSSTSAQREGCLITSSPSTNNPDSIWLGGIDFSQHGMAVRFFRILSGGARPIWTSLRTLLPMVSAPSTMARGWQVNGWAISSSTQ